MLAPGLRGTSGGSASAWSPGWERFLMRARPPFVLLTSPPSRAPASPLPSCGEPGGLAPHSVLSELSAHCPLALPRHNDGPGSCPRLLRGCPATTPRAPGRQGSGHTRPRNLPGRASVGCTGHGPGSGVAAVAPRPSPCTQPPPASPSASVLFWVMTGEPCTPQGPPQPSPVGRPLTW